jgi:hypothetical protein
VNAPETVDILLTYPPDSAAAIAAAQAVQVACDPYWIRPQAPARRTPGSVVCTITADGWPQVSRALRAAQPAGVSVTVTGADL